MNLISEDEALAILRSLKLLLLALWLGAALFFSAVVAPTSFAVLRSLQLPNASEIAGTIVSRSLGFINRSGFIIGLLLLIALCLSRKAYGKALFLLELLSLIVIVVGTGAGQWIIASRMLALRATMRLPIDQVPVDDPRRMEFNALHAYSVTALGIVMIAALVAFFAEARRARQP